MTDLENDIAALTQAEDARCKALMDGDVDALGALLAKDVAHIHIHGGVDGKDAYLVGVRDKFRFVSVARGPLDIRVTGDAAVMIGALVQTVKAVQTGTTRDVTLLTSQVWKRAGAGWQMAMCHNSVPAQ